MTIRSVLLDLDGTLADTAPDLAYALNEVRREQGLTALPFDAIRPWVSHGGLALTRLGFGIEPDAPAFAGLRQRLLDIYRDNLTRETQLFPGMPELLEGLETRGLRWGVVTNKPAWLTEPLLTELRLSQRATCIVSGDTMPNKKPHPESLLHACALSGHSPTECVYVGDAERDIEAGRRAGMRTLVALFGYLGEQDDPYAWNADGLVESPADILDWIDSSNALES